MSRKYRSTPFLRFQKRGIVLMSIGATTPSVAWAAEGAILTREVQRCAVEEGSRQVRVVRLVFGRLVAVGSLGGDQCRLYVSPWTRERRNQSAPEQTTRTQHILSFIRTPWGSRHGESAEAGVRDFGETEKRVIRRG